VSGGTMMIPRETERDVEMVNETIVRKQELPTEAQSADDKVIIFDWDDTICPSSFVDRFRVEQVDDIPTKVSFRKWLAAQFL
jgi:hypothetical protein